ncbi:hypothetical protein CDL17_03145 [Salmonella enterica subsp. enterica serovar Heidelberg]|nr:hypothetical protein CDL17_03145 [Salmonella enterica subsp. enterica serovar Heidelberg]
MTIAITDVVLRDAHQSLFATRLRLDDMLPIAAALDDVGYGSLECWGGATFDACIRFLGEDPWLRLRELKKAMPKTPLQMLLRGQNLLGYRHYADDVVERFVERAVKNGMDVFRVFDAMNDPRNMKAALQAVRSHGAHAQGTLSYTTSPAHTLQTWLDLTEQLLETGVDRGRPLCRARRQKRHGRLPRLRRHERPAQYESGPAGGTQPRGTCPGHALLHHQPGAHPADLAGFNGATAGNRR